MPITLKKGEENEEANTLIEFAHNEAKLEPEMLILLIKDLILEKQNEKEKYWSWKILEYVEQKTGAIQLNNDRDVDVEVGDWGLPVIAGVGYPLGYKTINKKYLVKLLEYLDDQVNHIFERITQFFIKNDKFIVKEDKTKWVCQNCNRYLGKSLGTYEEVQGLLTKFSIGEFWKCRSCKKNNWFEIDIQGVMYCYSD